PPQLHGAGLKARGAGETGGGATLLDQQSLHAVASEEESGGQADRPTTDDEHRNLHVIHACSSGRRKPTGRRRAAQAGSTTPRSTCSGSRRKLEDCWRRGQQGRATRPDRARPTEMHVPCLVIRSPALSNDL